MIEMLEYPLLQHALLAGVLVAVAAATMGYFLLARGLTFAGHALPNIGFAGAAGAVLLGLDPVIGLFAFTIAAGLGIGLLGQETRERDTAVGVVMTFALGLGLLFLSLYAGYAERVYSILFGQIIGISQQDVLITAGASLGTLLALLLLFRPLLFSSFDPELARARGVPVRLLSLVFLVLLAMTISLAVQVVGSLLIFTLLIGPPATAMRLTSRPLRALALASLLGISMTLLGIILAVDNGVWPVSFYIAALSFGTYLPVRLLSPLWLRRDRRARPDTTTAPLQRTDPQHAPECMAGSAR